MQSDRIAVFVGNPPREFKVPKGLLCRYSPVFKSMCNLPFEESEKQEIKLPEETAKMFYCFFQWVHAAEPSLDFDYLISVDTIIDLAIFGEKYQILLLKNQTSDNIRHRLEGKLAGDSFLWPQAIKRAYDNVPAKSILRRLCLLSLSTSHEPLSQSKSVHSNAIEWEQAFSGHADLGWDFFKEIQMQGANLADRRSKVASYHPCYYHDHSDVPDFKEPALVDPCRYPHGAPS